MRAFIVRPFGVKREIDFDWIERELIAPSLATLKIEGGSTAEFVEQGNIREDMFRQLLAADLVVADLTIHNANVFYELGIRHALRDKKTVLIRARVDEYPFDLSTDRYLEYDPKDPRAGVNALVAVIQATAAADKEDSPVFKLLPGLSAQNPARFLPVPQQFQEEVERAAGKGNLGDLALLATEARGFEWETPALRVVGQAQFDRQEYEGARISWEAVREADADDLEANLLLGTIYQRLGDLTESDLALKRALEGRAKRKTDRAEAFALRARNAKTRWLKQWRSAAPEQWRQQALSSPFLPQSQREYESGFNEDLNHYYSGLNALAMLTVMIELGAAQPDIWESLCEDDEEPGKKLEQCRRQQARLAAAVDLSVKAARRRSERDGQTDSWVGVSEADLTALTAAKPVRVAASYRAALASTPGINASSIRDQLQIYVDLGVCAGNAAAGLAELPLVTGNAAEKIGRCLLFTGLPLDAGDRGKPRFPPGKEDIAREAIRKAVQAELAISGTALTGIAGGASGGDILFHEVCRELGVQTRIYLAVSPEKFIAHSVAPAGSAWVDRFLRLLEKLPSRVLQTSEALPAWMHGRTGYDVWRRDNLWRLHNAFACGGSRATVIALWDGEAEDGPGGTADLVDQARGRGAKTVVVDTKVLFQLP